MFQRILVPLDGSTRAERALPVAAKIARASGGSVVLLRVIAPVPIAYNRYMSGISIGGLYGPAIEVPPAVDQEAKDGARDEAKRYLEVTAASRELQGITVETTVLFGAVASNIPSTISGRSSLTTSQKMPTLSSFSSSRSWTFCSTVEIVATVRVHLYLPLPAA